MSPSRPASSRRSSSSHRRSSLSSDTISPPPSYHTAASRPPSFRSGISDSVRGSDSDSILPASQTSKLSKKPKPSGTKWPLNPIPENEKPSSPPPPYTSPKRRRCPRFIWICFIVFLVAIIGIVPPIVISITERHHGAAAGNSTTSIITSVVRTTLVLQSTTILSSTAIVLVTLTTGSPSATIVTTASSATPSPFYLGGFDAIHAESGGSFNQMLFYTDQLGNIQQINGTSYVGWGSASGYDASWLPASPSVIAQDALPGSPVQAALLTSGEVQVFYVNNQSIIQNVVGNLTTVYSSYLGQYLSTYNWIAGSIGSLGLVTSKDAFVRVCVPDEFNYANPTPNLYLYYRSTAGNIVRYSWSNVSSPNWQALPGDQLPNIPANVNVECQFDSGIESLWTFSSNDMPQQWWRSVNTTGWNLGVLGDTSYGDTTAGPNSSILSITAGRDNDFGRSHIFFQDTDNRLVRYDIDGRGSNSTLANVTIYPDTATEGTRLSTWANGDSCEQDVDVYFQRDNTSQLHYLVFLDMGYFSNGYDLSDGEYHVVTTTVQDAVVDLIATWGNPPPKSSSQVHLKTWVIVVIVVVVILSLLAIGCCCCGCH